MSPTPEHTLTQIDWCLSHYDRQDAALEMLRAYRVLVAALPTGADRVRNMLCDVMTAVRAHTPGACSCQSEFDDCDRCARLGAITDGVEAVLRAALASRPAPTGGEGGLEQLAKETLERLDNHWLREPRALEAIILSALRRAQGGHR